MPLNRYLNQLRCPMDQAVESLLTGIAKSLGPLPDDVKADVLTHIVHLANYSYSHGAKLMKDKVLEALSWPKNSKP